MIRGRTRESCEDAQLKQTTEVIKARADQTAWRATEPFLRGGAAGNRMRWKRIGLRPG